MGRTFAGLRKRGNTWHIEKQIQGYGRLYESCRTSERAEAERYYVYRLEQIRQETLYGRRPEKLFREAATKYVEENTHLSSLSDQAYMLEQLDPFIGDLPLEQVHDETLRPFIAHRISQGMKHKTVNISLGLVRRILTLSARKWRDERGQTWLETPPLLTMLPLTDTRQPYPLSIDEQQRLFRELPAHLARMALFKVNTGTRDQEVCRLRWDWEIKLPELETSVFLIPGRFVKNREDRVVVLNDVARSVVESCRGEHPKVVFSYQGKAVKKMMATAWRKARERAADKLAKETGEPAPFGFSHVRVHDLKHTFGRRLRAAGVPLETRKVLLGHTTGDITSHYSAPELAELINAANRVCRTESGKTPALTLLKHRASK
ncbi:MAG TPA: tyrosine-type recombinase/integrase [Gammaproteobacteria bacterium]|jgi:integrase